MSHYQTPFHVIDLKLDIEPSLLYCRRSECSTASSAAAYCRLQHDARWSVVMNIYTQAAGGAYRTLILQLVRKQAPSGSVVPFYLLPSGGQWNSFCRSMTVTV